MGGDASFKSRNVGFDDGLIAGNRKQQGNIDRDTLEEQLLDGRDPGFRGRNLDVEIGTIHAFHICTRFIKRGLRVVRNMRRYFQTDIAIQSICFGIDVVQ